MTSQIAINNDALFNNMTKVSMTYDLNRLRYAFAFRLLMPMDLLQKYNVPAPRYTSYPTVPHWDNSPTREEWESHIQDGFSQANKKGISVYVHLPFCETFCTYCACNKVITKNHDLEVPYLKAIKSEWQNYKTLFGEEPRIKEIYLGGGTPTFFSAQHLTALFDVLKKDALWDESITISVEIHPMQVTFEQLEALRTSGVNRVSFGIQDTNEKVQKAINRLQPNEDVERVMAWVKELGFEASNFDLIYGLPFQTAESVTASMDLVKKLKPGRIAFYSYAHVPWKKNAQRLFTEVDLPSAEEKLALFETGQKLLLEMGYEQFGMDHFALPTDSLSIAANNGALHRNFMGYTTTDAAWLIGLGVSSISETDSMYLQNEKNVYSYQSKVAQSDWTAIAGHRLSQDEKMLRSHIMQLMCEGQTNTLELCDDSIKTKLDGMCQDGLVQFDGEVLKVTIAGRQFVRNVCAQIDPKMNPQHTGARFSKAV